MSCFTGTSGTNCQFVVNKIMEYAMTCAVVEFENGHTIPMFSNAGLAWLDVTACLHKS
jgi:hypothetical protein